jgi:cytochrome c-type biogenesis protein CcmH/NrfF
MISVVGVAALAVAATIAAVPVRAQEPASLTAAQSARAKDLGKRVKCMCGGCNDAAGSCYHSGGAFSGPCPMALDMLKKVDAHVANGESDDAILKSFVQEYGPTVLIEPPKSGFNLTAWIMPIVVPLIALIGVWEAVRRWRHRAVVAPAAGAGAPPVARDLLERVQRETGRD